MVHHAHATHGHMACDWGHSDRPSAPLVAWNGDRSLLRDIDGQKSSPGVPVQVNGTCGGHGEAG